jgi:hypothetical protein
MKTHGRFVEQLRVDTESEVGATVAGSSASRLYDMTNYDQAMFVFSMGLGTTNACIATCSSVVVDLVESSAASVAGTTLIGGKATIAIGTSLTTSIPLTAGCQAMILMSGSAASDTAATTGDSFRFGTGTNVVTFTFSSEASMINPTAANQTSTQAYFGSGSAVNATAAGGGTLLVDSIIANLKSDVLCCGGPNVFKFSTGGTHTIRIEAVNSDAPIFYNNTMATTRLVGWCAAAAVTIPVRADQLTATANKKLVGLRWTTLAQAIGVNVTCIRGPGRYQPSGFVGRQSS